MFGPSRREAKSGEADACPSPTCLAYVARCSCCNNINKLFVPLVVSGYSVNLELDKVEQNGESIFVKFSFRPGEYIN